MSRILSSVAQGEVERKSARQRSALAQAAKQGRWHGGKRPFGYEKDGRTVREAEAELIRRAYLDVIDGESLATIARRLNAAGAHTGQDNPWNHSSLRTMLTNPRYAGLRRHRPHDERADLRRTADVGIVGTARMACRRQRGHLSRRGAAVDRPVAAAPHTRAQGPTDRHRAVRRVRAAGAPRRHLTPACRLPLPFRRACGPRSRARRRLRVGGDCGQAVPDDAADLWQPQADTGALIRQATVLRRRCDDIAADYGTGLMTRAQFHTANVAVQQRLSEVEAELAAAGSHSPLSIVAAADVQATWDELSIAQRRTIIDALMVPVIHPAGRGARVFDPDTVEIRWR